MGRMGWEKRIWEEWDGRKEYGKVITGENVKWWIDLGRCVEQGKLPPVERVAAACFCGATFRQFV